MMTYIDYKDYAVVVIMLIGFPLTWLVCSIFAMIEIGCNFKDAWMRHYDQ